MPSRAACKHISFSPGGYSSIISFCNEIGALHNDDDDVNVDVDGEWSIVVVVAALQ